MSAYRLTDKQRKYKDCRLQGMNQSDAYREAYNAGNMTDASIWTAASRLENHPQIKAAIDQGKAKVEAKAIDAIAYTKAQAVQNSLDIMTEARGANQFGAAASANKHAAEMMGYVTQKMQEVPTRLEDLNDDQLDHLIRLVELRLAPSPEATQAGDADEAATRH